MARWIASVETGRRRRTVRVTADNAESARTAASAHGTVVWVRIKPPLVVPPGMNANDRATFLIRLAAMLASRMPPTEALETMGRFFKGRIRRASAEVLRNMVEGGMTLDQAIEADVRDFPASLGGLLRAGVKQGNTAEALREVAAYESRMQEVQRGGLSYVWKSVATFAMSAAMLWAGTYWLGPVVTSNGMFRDKGFDFAWIDRLGTTSMMVVGGTLALFVGLILVNTLGRKVAPVLADAVTMRVPWYKDVVMAKTNHVNLYRLGILIRTGMMDEEALIATARDSRPGVMKRDLTRAHHEMRDGRPWPRSLSVLHPTDRAALELASSRKDKANTLLTLSDQYDHLFRQRVEVLGPALASIGAIYMTWSSFVMFAQTMLPLIQLTGAMMESNNGMARKPAIHRSGPAPASRFYVPPKAGDGAASPPPATP